MRNKTVPAISASPNPLFSPMDGGCGTARSSADVAPLPSALLLHSLSTAESVRNIEEE
jgi:hypothetical protein